MNESLADNVQQNQKQVVGYFVPNWFGDSLMAWPALYAKINAEPEKQHIIITKHKLFELWKFLITNSDIQLLSYEDSFSGMRQLAEKLREKNMSRVHLFTETPRSYLVSFFAKIAVRIGRPRGLFSLLLNQRVSRPSGANRLHRAKEYFLLLNPGQNFEKNSWAPLATTSSIAESVEYALLRPCVALFPGAARGDSKRWPYFSDLATLLEQSGITPIILGNAADRDTTKDITAGINLCGTLSIPELAAIVSRVKVCVSNDSGGMHLVDTIGTPLVAIFGLTSPEITGPRRKTSTTIKADGRSNTAISKSDKEAEDALATITVNEVFQNIKSRISAT